MVWIIFGVLLFGVTGVVVKNNPALARYKSVGRIISLLFIVIGVLFYSERFKMMF